MAMKAHLIFAHPNLVSFNGSLRNTAIEVLESEGITVTVSDLYQMKFKASADAEDFKTLANLDFLDIQTEQLNALRTNTFAEDIQREHEALENADLVIFQFPLWWYSMPSLLKGYFDRVFSVGWAYGGGQALVGKKALISLTTGAPEFMWTPQNRGNMSQVLMHLTKGTLEFCGMQNLEPFIVYGAKRLSAEEQVAVYQKYSERLKEIIKR